MTEDPRARVEAIRLALPEATAAGTQQRYGLMFWLRRNRFPGSYCRLTETSRS
jgi:hypothetical protein